MSKIYVAIDTNDITIAKSLCSKLKNHIDGIKLGLEFFSTFGPKGVETLSKFNLPIFLDVKLYDIPNTVYKSIKSLCKLNIEMFTIHLSGSEEMIKAARQGASEGAYVYQIKTPKILGVTVLTSFEQMDLDIANVTTTLENQVLSLARIAYNNNLNGIICSGKELRLLKSNFKNDLLYVVPGIRLDGNSSEDQKRIMTPAQAKNLGADILIIGRPITESKNPVDAAKLIKNMIN